MRVIVQGWISVDVYNPKELGFPGEPYRGLEIVDDPGMKEDEGEDTIEDKVAAHKDE